MSGFITDIDYEAIEKIQRVNEWELFKRACSSYIYRSMLEGLNKNELNKIFDASEYLKEFENWVYDQEQKKLIQDNKTGMFCIPDLNELRREEIIKYYLEWVENNK